MKSKNLNKRAKRVRRKLKKYSADRYRLTVFRSLRNISAQIIDDKNKKTLVSASSLKEKGNNKKKIDLSVFVAEQLSKKAVEKNIKNVYKFSGKAYHNESLVAESEFSAMITSK